MCRGLQAITDDCLDAIWTVPKSWCLGDGGAYLTAECLNAYGGFLDIDEAQTVALATAWGGVQEYCGNEASRVCPVVQYCVCRTIA